MSAFLYLLGTQTLHLFGHQHYDDLLHAHIAQISIRMHWCTMHRTQGRDVSVLPNIVYGITSCGSPGAA
jgi:hypothetical protein